MKRWYVIQVYSGYEVAAKEDLERRIAKSVISEQFGEILVPSARVKSFLTTEEIKKEQLFPGYILIEMQLTPESMKIVLSSIRVSRFLGGINPKPLSDDEVAQIRAQITGEVIVKQDRPSFITGREVEIHDGPFAGFMGVISTVNNEHEKITVMVSIFGRMTPVDLGFHQVK